MRGRGSDLLTLGGRAPPVVGGLILGILGASLLGQLVRDVLAWGLLAPAAVLEGQLWRLVTWTFLSASPLELIFTALMLYWFGRDLAWAWGSRRLLLTWLGFSAAGGGVAVLLALFDARLQASVFAGPSTPMAALVVAWGLLYPERGLNFWGVLPLTGLQLVWITIGGTVFFGAFGGLRAVVPDLAAELLMLLWFRGLSLRGSWQSLRIWLGQRRMRRRAQHLRVVKKNGKGDPPQWLN